jgi:hypothetical protein
LPRTGRASAMQGQVKDSQMLKRQRHVFGSRIKA